MNTIPFRSLTPCGRTRREFLWQAGGGFVGAALTYLLAQDGFFPKALATAPDDCAFECLPDCQRLQVED